MTLMLHTTSIAEYFKDQVGTAISHQKARLSPDAEFYLVNLLTQFSNAEKLHSKNSNGEITDQALALQLFDAMVADPHAKIPILKKMGDIALYMSGFFSDNLFKKLMTPDYYINMGHTAYSSLSNIVSGDQGKTLSDLFGELAGNFVSLVDILSEVADATSLRNNQNLLKIYERWLKTGSDRMKNILDQHGIIANVNVKTGYEQ